MDIIAATYAYRTTYSSPYASSVDAASMGGFFAGFAIFFIAMIVIGLLINMALTWGVYKKGGYKGWEGIVPIYNNYCLYKMSGTSMTLFVISIFIPVVNICMFLELAKKFGKESIYGLGLFFFGFIFMPILGYGSAEFQGETADASKTTASEAKPANEAKPATAEVEAPKETSAKKSTEKKEAEKADEKTSE